MIAIRPITIDTVEYNPCIFLRLNPIKADEIPKNNKLNPTIIDINPDYIIKGKFFETIRNCFN